MEYAILVLVGCGMNSQPQKRKNRQMSKNSKKSVAPVATVTLSEKQSAEALKAHKVLMDQQHAKLAIEVRQGAEIKKLAREIIEATVATGKVYLKLCLYIRENMVAPKLVSAELAEMGFNKQVISRVNKVANASDEVFSLFAASTIGFNKALDMARNPVQDALATSMGTNVTDIKAQVEEMDKETEGAASGGSGTSELSQEQKDERMLKQFEQGAARALSAAASFGWKKERKVVGGNGYILIVRKDPKWRPAPAPDAVKAADVKTA